MRNSFLFFLLLFFYCESISQNPPFTTNYDFGSITFKNGAILEGFIIVQDNFDVKFKKKLYGKEKSIYKGHDIKTINIHGYTHEYKKIKNKKGKLKPLRVFIEGDLILYIELKHRKVSYDYNSFRNSNEEIHYYLGRKDELEVVYLRFGNSYSRKFLKITNNYFGDCISLIKKIKNWEFERFDVPGIVNYYNNDCSK